jgi:hypothetical protein
MRYAPRAFAPVKEAESLAEYGTLHQALEVARAMGAFPVFSRELYAGSDARGFCVSSFPEMAAWMRCVPPGLRKVHEHINEDVECRFVGDLDGAPKDHPNGEQALLECVEEMRTRVQKLLNLETLPRVVVGSTTRPKKLSVHVTFPDLILENWACVSALGKRILREAEKDGTVLAQVLDANVYARKSGTLRTMFCTGYGKEGHWMVPLGGTMEFSETIWLDALVTYVPIEAPPPRAYVDDQAPPTKKLRKKENVAAPDAFRGDIKLYQKVRDALSEDLAARHAREHDTVVDADYVECTRTTCGVFLKRFPCRFKPGELPHSGNRIAVTWEFAPNKIWLVGVGFKCMRAAPPCNRQGWEATHAELLEFNAVLTCVLARENAPPSSAEAAEAQAGKSESQASP